MFHYLYLKQKIMYNQLFAQHGIKEEVDDQELVEFLAKNWFFYICLD